jgi:hypothetical protein
MSNIIGVVTDPGVGGTFLNWTLHYLAGHKQIYSVKQDKWVELTDNPLNDINAHNFKANQSLSLIKFDLMFDKLVHQQSKSFHTIYFHHFSSFDTDCADTGKAIRHLQSNINKGIILSLNDNQCLYQVGYQPRSELIKWTDENVILTDSDEIFNNYINYFFKDSEEKWNKLELNDVWDKREFIALNVNYNKTMSIRQLVDNENQFYVLNCMDLFNTFDTTVYKLFEYLNLKIDLTRFKKWTVVYAKWKQLQYNRIRFVWYFDSIIKNIILGKEMDLEQFDLDIMQEAAIQRELIYTHSLNLKTWQLEKFTNTKQLHDLLEPNLHNLNAN